MKFHLLGPMHIVTDDGRKVPMKASKASRLLAVLLLRPREVVGTAVLIDELWGGDPPRSAMTTLQTYVYHQRRMFAAARVTRPDRHPLLTRPPGYTMHIEDDELDVRSFTRLIDRGDRLLNAGRPEEAIVPLTAALDMWTGPPLATVARGPVLENHLIHLEEIRLRAVQLRIDATWRLGRFGSLVPELRSLVMSHPLNEALHAQLMEALYRVGRRAEALQCYRILHEMLATELGVEPGPDVQRVHMRILNAGRVLARP